jgi:hypothetical protein
MKVKFPLFLGVLGLCSILSKAQTGYVGIGTTVPHTTLDLGYSFGANLTDSVGKKLAIYNNISGSDFYGLGIAAGYLLFHVANTRTDAPDMFLTSAGDLTIVGTTATKGSGGSGTSWAVTSDARSKKNIQPFTVGLQEIIKIEPKTFQYNGRFGTKDNGEIITGILAQDLQKVLPNSIQTVKTDKGESFLQLKTTDQILFGLVNAVKEMQREIETLKTENTGLKAAADQSKTMQTQIQQLQSAVEKLQATNQTTFAAEAKQ